MPRRPPSRARTWRRALGALAAGVLALTACSALREVRGFSTSTQPPPTTSTTTSTTVAATTSAVATTTTVPPPYPVPAVGACRAGAGLDVLAEVSDERDAVPCGQAHGGETVALLDGLLVAVSERPEARGALPEFLANRASRRCQAAVDAHVGNPQRGAPGRVASRIVTAWFVPAPAEWALGARWIRCDAVVAPVPGVPSTFAGSLRGALAGSQVPAPLAACFDGGWLRARCDAAHAFEAVADAGLPDGADVPDADMLGAVRLAQCDPAVASAIGIDTMADQPALTSILTFPSSAEWADGERIGLCSVAAADGRALDDSVRGLGTSPPPLVIVAPPPTG